MNLRVAFAEVRSTHAISAFGSDARAPGQFISRVRTAMTEM